MWYVAVDMQCYLEVADSEIVGIRVHGSGFVLGNVSLGP